MSVALANHGANQCGKNFPSIYYVHAIYQINEKMDLLLIWTYFHTRDMVPSLIWKEDIGGAERGSSEHWFLAFYVPY